MDTPHREQQEIRSRRQLASGLVIGNVQIAALLLALACLALNAGQEVLPWRTEIALLSIVVMLLVASGSRLYYTAWLRQARDAHDLLMQGLSS